jgi:Ca-activated chloride channel family protein
MDIFNHPIVLLWGLFGLIAAVLAYLASEARRAKLMAALGDIGTLSRLFPAMAAQRRRLKAWLLFAALALIFIALAGPQWGLETDNGDNSASAGHLVIALDTSLSMNARDIQPSRIESAKLMLKLLIEQLGGYRMGIVAFAGKAYVECPLTTDADALKYFLSSVSVDMLPERGTSLESAVTTSAGMLSRYPGHKAVVLLTDGEDHEGKLKEAEKSAADAGVAIIAVGIGKPEGELIPVGDSGTDYKKDKEGHPVVSKLGEKTLVEMAAATGGAYIRYSDAETASSQIATQLKKLEKLRWQSKSRAHYRNHYRIPLILALLALVLELLIPEGELSFSEICRIGDFKKSAGSKS